jgi:hypothetical protein
VATSTTYDVDERVGDRVHVDDVGAVGDAPFEFAQPYRSHVDH